MSFGSVFGVIQNGIYSFDYVDSPSSSDNITYYLKYQISDDGNTIDVSSGVLGYDNSNINCLMAQELYIPSMDGIIQTVNTSLGNVFQDNRDASFNNVDISNNKTYNDLSNNDNAVLNLGQLKQYNVIDTYALMISLDPSWITITNSVHQQLTNLSATSFTGYTDYTSDFSSNTWKPSVVGLFSVYAQAFIQSPDWDKMTQTALHLREGGTFIHSSQYALENSNSPADDMINYTLQLQTIISVTQTMIDENTSYDLAVYGRATSGSPTVVGYNGRYTFWTIHKIA